MTFTARVLAIQISTDTTKGKCCTNVCSVQLHTSEYPYKLVCLPKRISANADKVSNGDWFISLDGTVNQFG